VIAINTILSEAPDQSFVSVQQIAVPALTEQSIFGERKDNLPINENIYGALKKHGFT